MTLEQIKVAVKKGLTIHYSDASHTVVRHSIQPGRDPRVQEDEFVIHHDYLRTPLEYQGQLNGRASWYYPPVTSVLGYYTQNGSPLKSPCHAMPNRLVMFKDPNGMPLWVVISNASVFPEEQHQPHAGDAVEAAIDVLERHFYGHGHPYTDYPWAANLDVVV